MMFILFFGFQFIICCCGEVLSGECEMSYVYYFFFCVFEDLFDYIDEFVMVVYELFCKFLFEKFVGVVECYFKERLVCKFFVVVVGLQYGFKKKDI